MKKITIDKWELINREDNESLWEINVVIDTIDFESVYTWESKEDALAWGWDQFGCGPEEAT